MKKLLFPILFLLLLLGVAAYFMLNKDGTTIKGELSDFAVRDTSSITKIFLADESGNTILLERQKNNWLLNKKYTARKDAVFNLLDGVSRLAVKAPVAKAAFETVVKNIAGKHTKVEIYQNDEKEPSKVFYVGGANQGHSGSYFLMEGSSQPFLVHIEGFYGFLTPRFFTNENEWRDNIIYGYEYGEIAEIQVEFPDLPEQSYKITDMGNDEFSLTKLKTGDKIEFFDSLGVKQYVAFFKLIPYEGFEETKTEQFIDSITQTTPMQIYTVTTKGGEKKQVKTFKKPMRDGNVDEEGNPIEFDYDRLYAEIDGKDFVVIQYHIFDKLDRKLGYYLPLDSSANRQKTVDNSAK